MFALSRHPDSHVVSFQERQSLSSRLKSPEAQLGNANFAFSTRFVVDVTLLERSLENACQIHEAPLTRFAANAAGELERHRVPSSLRHFVLKTLRHGTSLDDPGVNEQLVAFCDEPFRISSEEWLRALVIHTADNASVIGIRMPHVICDAVGMSVFVTDVWRHYEAQVTGQEAKIAVPSFTLRDYAASQQAWAASDDFRRQFERQVTYNVEQMRALLADLPDAPVKRPTRALLGVEAYLPPEIEARLPMLAKLTRTNAANVLVACALVCIARVHEQRAFCYRLPFSARVSHQFEKIVGFLSTDLIMFARLDPDMSFLAFIAQIQRESLSLMRHGALPWPQIRERLRAQVSDVLLDDYTINIIPPQPSFSAQAEFETHPFPVPVFGDANYRLKVLVTQHTRGTRIALRMGEEERGHAQTQLLPQFMSTLCALIDHPESRLGDAMLASYSPASASALCD